MHLPIRELDRRTSCFLAVGLKPRLPMGRIQRLKAFVLGRLFKINR
jgi:hypothetical protein